MVGYLTFGLLGAANWATGNPILGTVSLWVAVASYVLTRHAPPDPHDEPTDAENRLAYHARRARGEQLATYSPDVDYTRPVGGRAL